MGSKRQGKALLVAVILGNFYWSGQSVAAQEVGEFNLDPLVITAQRTETKELETPAAIEVYDRERIEKTGGANAYDILQNTLGVVTQSQGFNGTSMGTMTSKIMIRGVEKGTLVLVDGIAVNQDGKYNLEDIAADAIERIEVVKGGGAVLYGSEATGGVINIITRKNVQNSLKIAAGNYGKERYALNLGAGKFSLVAGYENRGEASPLSAPSASSTTFYDYGGGEHKNISWKYRFSDALTFTHNYSDNKHEYWQRDLKTTTYNGKISQINNYINHSNDFLLNYNKDGWRANLAYGTQEKDSRQGKVSLAGIIAAPQTTGWRKGHNTNIDVQKLFNLGRNKVIIGADYKKEDMDVFANTNSRRSKNHSTSVFQRDTYSLYASYDWAVTDVDNVLVNVRQTWARGVTGWQKNLDTAVESKVDNDNMRKFTPEINYLHKLSDTSSLYAKAGKSFRMPNLTQIFGSGELNPNVALKPEQGTHYELGYKLNEGKRTWRFALFNYRIKDSIDAVVVRDSNEVHSITYTNQDVRNTGAELSLGIEHDDNFSSAWGLMVHNPQNKSYTDYNDHAWHDAYGKVQLTGALNYKKDKFTSSLNANYVGKRTSNEKTQRKIRPQLFTDLHLTYTPTKEHKLYLHLNNLLDRKDITTNATSNYYTLGRNFILGYEYNF
ncbi:MAG TPA: TonB-dependent receptor [Candidatus Avacidaminococcus intestinavium]|uniref:TonB-dependent receptor n=1 Tax=Candidatus Avacidaminococcus intestinavium TaxID=2840684 RepID=A0A9D1SLW3_9FIRM|nr:TonB-dependent receptor [Candidatus Avacidaminococcus intestinavium]